MYEWFHALTNRLLNDGAITYEEYEILKAEADNCSDGWPCPIPSNWDPEIGEFRK